MVIFVYDNAFFKFSQIWCGCVGVEVDTFSRSREAHPGIEKNESASVTRRLVLAGSGNTMCATGTQVSVSEKTAKEGLKLASINNSNRCRTQKILQKILAKVF